MAYIIFILYIIFICVCQGVRACDLHVHPIRNSEHLTEQLVVYAKRTGEARTVFLYRENCVPV